MTRSQHHGPQCPVNRPSPPAHSANVHASHGKASNGVPRDLGASLERRLLTQSHALLCRWPDRAVGCSVVAARARSRGRPRLRPSAPGALVAGGGLGDLPDPGGARLGSHREGDPAEELLPRRRREGGEAGRRRGDRLAGGGEAWAESGGRALCAADQHAALADGRQHVPVRRELEFFDARFDRFRALHLGEELEVVLGHGVGPT